MTGSRRLPWAVLAAHVGLIAFSTAAMLTVLNGSTSVDLTSEPAATIMRVSYRFAGPTYVVLGAVAALAFLASVSGMRTAIAVAVTSSALALGAEVAGTSSGLPFGDYRYSGLLGHLVFGLVPFPIPISWFYMLVGSLAITARLFTATDANAGRWRWALAAGLLMVAWDISMDPAMVKTAHWIWGPGTMFRESGLPAWLVAFFTADAFYGMPLSNWLGWLVTATLIARVMLAIAPPTRVQREWSTSPFPIVLYLANGIMPVALCLRDGFWWAAALGALGMALPAGLALRTLVRREAVDLAARHAA